MYNELTDQELFDKAVEFTKTQGFVSVPKLQIMYALGFHKAEKLMHKIEEHGILGGIKGQFYIDRPYIQPTKNLSDDHN